MQAINQDGPGIISETIEVTTGKKHIPLSVKLEVVDPKVEEGDDETVVEPRQLIQFRCVVEGRPMPTVSYSWLPFNETESGEEPVPMPANPDKSKEHRYMTDVFTTSTSTKRSLLCQVKALYYTLKAVQPLIMYLASKTP